MGDAVQSNGRREGMDVDAAPNGLPGEQSLKARYDALVLQSVGFRLRVVATVGAILFILFSILDRAVYPEHAPHFFAIRVVSSILFCLFGWLSLHRRFEQRALWLADLLFITAGGAICIFIYLSDGSASNYYQGLHLVFLAMLVVNSFSEEHHYICGLLILGFYLAAAVRADAPIVPGQLVSGLFFVGSTLVFVALFAKLFRKQHYREFLTTCRLEVTAEQLKVTNAKILETERLKDEFFANVSHELRTPLTLAIAPAESLLAGEFGPLSPSQEGPVEIIRNNGLRLLQLVNGLLDFATLEAGKVEVQRTAVAVGDLTKRLMHDFEPLMQRSGIEWTYEEELTASVLDIDAYLYERILFNLLSNAIKFTERGGRIEVALRGDGSLLELAVSDTGIGIAKEDRARLFQTFRQLEGSSSRRFEGSGLGLALVKEFAALLGGDVDIESEPGVGSTFRVSISAPASAASEGAAFEAAEKRLVLPYEGVLEGGDAGTAPGKSLRVLLAEDNQELSLYIESLLRPLARVRRAFDGEEALAIAREWKPDLVLSDVMMPKLDGVTLCRTLKADERFSSIKVVLLTALTHRDALLKGWEAGADEYLFKPFHPKELVTRISSLLDAIHDRRIWEQRHERSLRELSRSEAEVELLRLYSLLSSHHLREPLRKISLYTGKLLRRAEGIVEEDQLHELRKVLAVAERMNSYLDQILTYSDVAAAGPGYDRVSLETIFQEVLDELEPLRSHLGAVIEHDPLPEMEGNPRLIKELLFHLLENALRYVAPGAIPRISVQAPRKPEGEIELRITDNGIGFPQEEAEAIFSPFKRLHTFSEYPGTGLGLAICRRVVLQHGGSISASSMPGGGSTFTVHLPAVAKRFDASRTMESVEIR